LWHQRARPVVRVRRQSGPEVDRAVTESAVIVRIAGIAIILGLQIDSCCVLFPLFPFSLVSFLIPVMRNLTVFILLVVSSSLFGQTAAGKLIQAAQQAPTLEKNLRVLTDEIGGRIPGTPAMERAVQWAVNAFKAA